MPATWKQVLTEIEQKVPEPTFNRWFRPLCAKQKNDGVLYLIADDEFDALFIEKNFAELIRLHLERIMGPNIDLNITHESPSDVQNRQEEPQQAPEKPLPPIRPVRRSEPEPLRVAQTFTERILRAGLRLQFSFDQFVVGASNEFAHAASRAIVEKPGKIYNPLFLYGSVGLGKTHLANAVGMELTRLDLNRRVHYTNGEAFTNEVIEHIRANDMTTFRNFYRHTIDTLVIDDIQFIAGKEATQNEFFHTFNALHQAGYQIVITSDQYPHEIDKLEERLRSRFQWGLIVDIQPPNIETRIAILKTKAANLDFDLPDDIALYLAKNIRTNIRELEGALLRLHAFTAFNKQPLSLEVAQTLLGRFLQDSHPTISVEMIQKLTCSYFNVKLSDMKGTGRSRAISRPRQIAMYLAKKYTRLSYPQLGSRFGGRDHTTVLSACRKIASAIDHDITITPAVQHLERQLPNY